MINVADIIVREKTWRIWVTNDRAIYAEWVREGKVCFSTHELDGIMDGEPNHDDMHWALVVKQVSPGVKITDVKKRKIEQPRKKPGVADRPGVPL